MVIETGASNHFPSLGYGRFLSADDHLDPPGCSLHASRMFPLLLFSCFLVVWQSGVYGIILTGIFRPQREGPRLVVNCGTADGGRFREKNRRQFCGLLAFKVSLVAVLLLLH